MSALGDVPLSVLDLAWREHGQTNADAVRASVELARAAEDLGFARYWLAEHHGLPSSTASQPPILIGAVAAATRTIRVGSGALLLANSSPLAVAEQFGTLRALHGDRIDLGVGRSSGGFPAAGRRTGRSGAPSDHPQDLVDLLGLFHGGLRPDNPLAHVLAVPGRGDAPEIWLLGSTSGVSAELAGALGLPFAYAHHFAAEDTERLLDRYRESFRPSEHLRRPHTMISVMLATDDDPAVVQEETLASAITHLRLLRGERPQPVSAEQARSYAFTPRDHEVLALRHARQAIGTTDEVEERLRSLVASTGADELLFQVVGATAAGRRRSLARVAQMGR